METITLDDIKKQIADLEEQWNKTKAASNRYERMAISYDSEEWKRYDELFHELEVIEELQGYFENIVRLAENHEYLTYGLARVANKFHNEDATYEIAIVKK